MDLIADILLGAGAPGAGVYCLVLARRLKQFNQLENGMGGAIAVLSAQVDDMTQALEQARTTAQASAETLRALSARSEVAAERLEVLLASLHDLPDRETALDRQPEAKPRVVRRRFRNEIPADIEAAE